MKELMALLETYPVLLKVLVAFAIMGFLFVIYLCVFIFWKLLSDPKQAQQKVDKEQSDQIKELSNEIKRVRTLEDELEAIKKSMKEQ